MLKQTLKNFPYTKPNEKKALLITVITNVFWQKEIIPKPL